MEILEGFTTVEQLLMAKAAKNHTPINGSIELLPLCNMNCDMCYVRLSREEMERQGRLRTWQEWLEIARQMKDAGTLFLLLTGGEPLIYPGFKELFAKLQQLGMILTINTNGTMIDEDWADFFQKNKPRRINITLYGASETTYCNLCHYPGGFEKVINGIKLLRERHVDVRVGVSLTRENQEEVEKIYRIGKELDVPVFLDTYMLPAVREREKPFCMQSRALPKDAARVNVNIMKKELDEQMFRQYLEKTFQEIQEVESGKTYPCGISCYAGQCSFSINWQGELHPCVILTQPSMPVFENGFAASWNHIVEGCQKLKTNVKCSTCSMRPVCKTCVAGALCETGEHEGVPTYLCEFSEETIRLLKQEAGK